MLPFIGSAGMGCGGELVTAHVAGAGLAPQVLGLPPVDPLDPPAPPELL
jgi:hypothetical protein